jgi:hypothetical protein
LTSVIFGTYWYFVFLFLWNFTSSSPDLCPNQPYKSKSNLNYTFSVDTVIITLIGRDTQYIEACKTYVDAGAVAFSNINGDVSHYIKDSSNLNTNLPGSYTITYYFPSGIGYWADSVKRTVIVTTSLSLPTIKLNGEDTLYLAVFNQYYDPGYNASDTCSGLKETHSTGFVDTAKIGCYTIQYYATNNAGLSISATRVIFVVDTIAPVLNLSGDPYVLVEKYEYENYQEKGCTIKDNYDSGILPIRGGTYYSEFLKTLQKGLYTISYDATDLSGNMANTAIRLVEVYIRPGSIKDYNSPNSINLYPNPTQDVVFLDCDSPELKRAEVTVVNLYGKIIRFVGELNCPLKKYGIDLEGLAEGVYFVYIRSNNNFESYKVILKK